MEATFVEVEDLQKISSFVTEAKVFDWKINYCRQYMNHKTDKTRCYFLPYRNVKYIQCKPQMRREARSSG